MKSRLFHIKYLLVLPSCVVLFLLVIYPTVSLINMSLHDVTLWNFDNPDFVGINNYLAILSDLGFFVSLRNTFTFMVVAVTLEYWLGLGIALLLDRELRGMRILTSLIVLPCMVTPVVVGILWKFMLASELGVVSEVLASIGLPKQAWLASPGTSLLAIALIDVWQWTPFMFLIMLAGLKTLPREPFEAARIDGASHWQIFRQVTLPLLRNATIVALLFRIMDSFKIFDTIWGLTRGGPGSATTTISVEIYVEAFRSFRFGYSAALSLLALIVVTLSVFSVLRFTYARLEE